MPSPDQLGAIATLVSALAVLLGSIRLGRSKVKTDDIAKLDKEIADRDKRIEELEKDRDEAEAHEVERDTRERNLREDMNKSRAEVLALLASVYAYQRLLAAHGIVDPSLAPTPSPEDAP